MPEIPEPKVEKAKEQPVRGMVVDLAAFQVLKKLSDWSKPYREPDSRVLLTTENGVAILHQTLKTIPDSKAIANFQHELLDQYKDHWPAVRFRPGAQGKSKDNEIWIEVRLTPKSSRDLSFEKKRTEKGSITPRQQ